MCAMIPMFRSLSRRAAGSICFTATTAISVLPPEVRLFLVAEVAKRLVGFRHAVRLFLAPDRAAGVVGGVDELVRQLLGHAAAVAPAREPHEPAPRQRGTPVGPDLDGDLVRGAADAAGLDLEERRGVAQGLLEHLERLLARLPSRAAKGVVHHALGDRALAVVHDDVHELRHGLGVVDRVRRDGSLGWLVPAWHVPYLAAFFSRLAPYLERPCLRLRAPAVSS